MNQRRQRSSNPKENPCHICRYQEYIWGSSVAVARFIFVLKESCSEVVKYFTLVSAIGAIVYSFSLIM
ncbi:MAG: hypothetical protein WBA07_18385 [Rivularia sp. (in: cyanobacteria)]